MSEPVDEQLVAEREAQDAEAQRALEAEREQARQLLHAAETLARLSGLEEFKFLRAETEKKRERMANALATRILSGEELDLVQRQVDYDRGFVEGMMYPFSAVAGAVNKLKEFDEKRSEPEEEEVTDMWNRYGS